MALNEGLTNYFLNSTYLDLLTAFHDLLIATLNAFGFFLLIRILSSDIYEIGKSKSDIVFSS